jgi:hypothetical protein
MYYYYFVLCFGLTNVEVFLSLFTIAIGLCSFSSLRMIFSLFTNTHTHSHPHTYT